MTQDRWLSTKEVAMLIGFSAETLKRWRMNRGGPPYSMIGRAVRYRESEVSEWMQARRPGVPRTNVRRH